MKIKQLLSLAVISLLTFTGTVFAGSLLDHKVGNVFLGNSEIDAGTVTGIMGAQTGDPQYVIELSSDDQGNLSVTTDTGDITLATNDDIYFTPTGGDIHAQGNITMSDATPKLAIWDTSATAGDDSASINVDCTDVGDTTEDCDVTFTQQQGGADKNFLVADADGSIQLGWPSQNVVVSGKISGITTDLKGTANTALTISVPDQGANTNAGVGMTINADDGGTGTTGGAGGALRITAGDAKGTGDNAGGITRLDGGAKTGAGAPGYVSIGTGAPTQVLDEDSLFVNDKLEVDGTANFDGGLTGSTIVGTSYFALGDNDLFYFGDGNDAIFAWELADTDAHYLNLAIGASRNFIISEDPDINWGHATSTDPTLWIQGADATDTDDYLKMYHDDTNGWIWSGAGALFLDSPAGINLRDGSVTALQVLSDGTQATITPAAGDYLRVGDATTAGHFGTPTNDDFLVTGRFEVDGSAYLDNGGFTYNHFLFSDDIQLQMGTSADSIASWATNSTGDDMMVYSNKALADGTSAMFYNRDVNISGMTDHDNYLSPTFVITNDEGADVNDYAGVVIGERAQANVAVTHYFDFLAMTGSTDAAVDVTTTELAPMFRIGDSGTATSDHSLGAGDVLFEDDVEIDGSLYTDGVLDAGNDIQMGDNKITGLADATDPGDAVNFQTLLDNVGVGLNYWIGDQTLDQSNTDSEASLQETPDADPKTLTTIYFVATEAETPTPFTVAEGAIVHIHFVADVTTTAAKYTEQLKFQLGYVDSDGSSNFVQIGVDSDLSPALTAVKTSYIAHFHVTTAITVPATKRLYLRVIADADTGAGAGYPEINFYYDAPEHVVHFVVGGQILGNYLPIAGGTMTGAIAMGGNDTTGQGDAVFNTGKAIQSGTTAADTLLLQAYDVDGTAYTTFGTFTANNTPTFDLTSAVTANSETLTTAATTDTFTNKTLDCNGTGNSCSNIDVSADVTGVLPVANGGTNASTASVTSFNNITGYTASGATGTTSTNLVFSTSPTLITPALGVPSALVGTNISGTGASFTAGTVTTNANLTGIVTSTGNATAIANKAIAIAKLADGTDGELITWGTTGVIETVAVGTINHVLTSNGVGAAPTFQAAAGGASLALDNLASVQINTDLLSDAADTDSLGTTDAEWLNGYFGDAGKLYFGLGQDASIHRNAANEMTLTATSGVTTSNNVTIGLNADVNYALTFDGDTSDGVIEWDEDNDKFLMDDITADVTGALSGNATTVTNGVYTTDFPLNQNTTGKADTAGNADTVTNGVYTTDNMSVLSATTSLQFIGVISDETGTGKACFATAPTFTTSIDVSGGGVIDADGIDLVTGNDYQINNASVLNATTLGGAVLDSSLTSLGTIGSLVATTADINAGTVDATIGGTTPAVGTFTTGTFGDTASLVLGTANSATGQLTFKNSTNANNTIIQPGAAAASVTYTWPTNVGDAGTALTDAAGDGTLSWAAAGGLATDVQIFNTDDTWTKPADALWVEVFMVGGGGGGGGGRRGVAGVARSGGGGGGGGAMVQMTFDADTLGATETVVAGTGGLGGVAQSSDDTNGNDGIDGEASSFGSWATTTIGNKGSGGETSTGALGAGSISYFQGFVTSAALGTGAAGDDNIGGDSTDYQFTLNPTGGGGGGGVTSGNVQTIGGTGGDRTATPFKALAGGASGAVDGGVGGAGNGTANDPSMGGTGGGGGGGHDDGAGGTGGAGAAPGGGGGGGAGSVNSFNSGAGGAGGDGVVVVVTYR